ncbi:aspartate aminotransferase family protein [Nocardioides agariphilus]|jgi:taurine--2-oxoglutarate transaminase|uniref:Aspartate aminotransferase family protein n=1 Tax=Nocardioides agariphilus TaxID=433664 RepID=A0A930VPQ9_9ACTN|nr:aspartate aminotransferase family protein [Nocardioides agariphilus]MBF4769546.1 aspartate aminotransferase family protein [Nocardioides agariphilus]
MTETKSDLVDLTPDRVHELDRKHVFHSWSAQGALNPMVITKAEGSYIWDQDGQRLLDFTSQLVFTNLGHQHPRIVSAIQEQAAYLCTVAPQHANAARSEAARLISTHTPGDLDKVFFTNGGADANEHAIRMARLHTGRIKVLSTYRSYHGGTHLAVNVTGDPRRWASDHGAAGTVHFFGPFLYRSQFHATTEAEECERALQHLANIIAMEGPQTIAAIMLEAIPGTAGIMVPPPGYLSGVRALCDQHGIVLIADEVMSGFGRSGRWFASELDGLVPDLLTFAKGVNSGYVPLGGVAISAEIAATFDERVYPGGLTYSGHPLACAAAVATIRTMEDDRVVEHAAALGDEVFAPGLAELARKHEWVGEVRGTGAFWAIELVKDKATREPLAPYGGTSPAVNSVVAECKKRGMLPFVNFNRVHLVPPLTTSALEVTEAIEILDEALTAAAG